MSLNTPASSPRVLYVDDEAPALKYFDRVFNDEFSIVTAQNAADARQILDNSEAPIGVLLSDQRMPGEQGVDLLDYSRKQHPLTVRILTTAYSDLPSAIAAVNTGGAYQYVTKPWDFDSLRILLRQALDLYQLRVSHDELLAQKAFIWQQLSHSDSMRGLLGFCAAAERWNPQALHGLWEYSQAAKKLRENQASCNHSLVTNDKGAAEYEFLTRLARMIHRVTPTDPVSIQELDLNAVFYESIHRFEQMESPEGVSVLSSDITPGVKVVSDSTRLIAIISLLLGRISNLDGDDIAIQLSVKNHDTAYLILTMIAREKTWTVDQSLPLFAAVDAFISDSSDHSMDLLPIYLMAAELGVKLDTVHPAPGVFAGFQVMIPKQLLMGAPQLTPFDVAAMLTNEPYSSELLIPSAD